MSVAGVGGSQGVSRASSFKVNADWSCEGFAPLSFKFRRSGLSVAEYMGNPILLMRGDYYRDASQDWVAGRVVECSVARGGLSFRGELLPGVVGLLAERRRIGEPRAEVEIFEVGEDRQGRVVAIRASLLSLRIQQEERIPFRVLIRNPTDKEQDSRVIWS